MDDTSRIMLDAMNTHSVELHDDDDDDDKHHVLTQNVFEISLFRCYLFL